MIRGRFSLLAHAETTQVYRPQLDGLRAVAVAAVLVQHFWPSYHWFKQLLDWGGYGVHLFFVLSGTLIGSIVLRGASRCDSLSDRAAFLRAFYLRRSLRILPVYIIALTLGLAFALPGFWEFLLFHLSFTTNYATASGGVGAATHFWSLAVEEQFYLLVPALLLFAPRRLVLPFVLGLIAAGLVTRCYSSVSGMPLTWADPTVSSFTALGLGVLLAYVQRPDAPRWTRRTLVMASLFIGWPLLILSTMAEPFGAAVSLRTIFADLAFVALVAAAHDGMRGVFGQLLSWWPVTAVGRVSYGIYVYHFIIPHVVSAVPPLFGYDAPSWSLWLIASYLPLTAALVVASWFLVERPLLRLKDRFTYVPRAAVEQVTRRAPVGQTVRVAA